MSIYGRAVRGAEAGAIAAGAVEFSFFVLDLIRLRPLATPFTLSGVLPGPGGFVLDLTSFAGVMAGLWATYQVLMLTFTHFLAFGLVGVLGAGCSTSRPSASTSLFTRSRSCTPWSSSWTRP